MNIADTILEQLGGGRFQAMTRTKNPRATGDGKTLILDLTKNISGARYLSITLTSKDLYTMVFSTIKKIGGKRKLVEIKRYEEVSNIMLQKKFTEVTGLYTRLF